MRILYIFTLFFICGCYDRFYPPITMSAFNTVDYNIKVIYKGEKPKFYPFTSCRQAIIGKVDKEGNNIIEGILVVNKKGKVVSHLKKSQVQKMIKQQRGSSNRNPTWVFGSHGWKLINLKRNAYKCLNGIVIQ